MDPKAAPRFRYLDADALARLGTLQLRVRHAVDGAMAGIHRSLHRGASVEFAEHKEYAPGDDLRRLDWKAYAKFDRYYIRQHEDETELKAYLLLDASGSMGYGAPLSKLEYGSVLVAGLSYLLVRQRDRPSLLAFADEVRCYVPPRSRASHTAAVLSALETLSPGGQTDLGSALSQIVESLARRSLVVVVSDMFEVSGQGLDLLRRLRARNHQVALVHLLHRDELEFPFSEVTLFEAMERDQRLLVDAAGARRSYLEQMRRFCSETAGVCRDAEILYERVTTADPVDRVLRSLIDGTRRVAPSGGSGARR